MLQDEMLKKLQSSRRREEEAHARQNPTVLRQVIQDKLRLVVELDNKLLRFADGLPHGLRPTDYLYADSASLPSLTFLAVQYYQAVFLVSRNALLINMQTVQSEIDKTFEGSQAITFDNTVRHQDLFWYLRLAPDAVLNCVEGLKA